WLFRLEMTAEPTAQRKVAAGQDDDLNGPPILGFQLARIGECLAQVVSPANERPRFDLGELRGISANDVLFWRVRLLRPRLMCEVSTCDRVKFLLKPAHRCVSRRKCGRGMDGIVTGAGDGASELRALPLLAIKPSDWRVP